MVQNDPKDLRIFASKAEFLMTQYSDTNGRNDSQEPDGYRQSDRGQCGAHLSAIFQCKRNIGRVLKTNAFRWSCSAWIRTLWRLRLSWADHGPLP